MSSVLSLARPDILQLQPYQHATWDPSLERMHANEMPWRAQGDNTSAGLNRYVPFSTVGQMGAEPYFFRSGQREAESGWNARSAGMVSRRW